MYHEEGFLILVENLILSGFDLFLDLNVMRRMWKAIPFLPPRPMHLS